MAKKKELPAGLVELPAQAGAEGAVAVADAPEAPEATPRFLVELNCPTPLLYPALEVEAANEDEARQKFCEANGISGSRHPWTVRRVG